MEFSYIPIPDLDGIYLRVIFKVLIIFILETKKINSQHVIKGRLREARY